MEESKKKSNTLLLRISITSTAILLAYILSFTTTINSLELKFLNMRYDLRGPVELKENPIVIVKIDDQSDEAVVDRWPWPRDYYAHLIENLNDAGAAVIGLDIILDKADKHNPESDDALAAVLNKYDNVVLAGKMLRSGVAETVYEPYEKFLTEKSEWGLVAVESDLDGFYRRYLVLDQYRDKVMPSFVAQIYKKFHNIKDSNYFKNSLDFFHLGEKEIPKFASNSMLINFHGPAYTFPGYSFDEVIDDEEFDLHEDYDMDTFSDPGDIELGIDPGLKYTGQLKDKIVLVGSTIFEHHDIFPTPYLSTVDSAGNEAIVEMPGVELHANALSTILNESYLYQPSRLQGVLLVVLIAFIIFIFTYRFSTITSTVLTVLVAGVFTLLSIFLFTEVNLILELVTPILAVGFSYMGNTIYNYLQTQKEKKMLRGAFAHYVPEKVVQELVNHPEKLQLGGEEREVSVMFSDVAGFTTVSEKLTPRELVVLLNEYLTAMTNIVLENNGIIDKYEGDAIMAEFGMPVPYESHPQAACRTALHMQEKLVELRAKWKREGRPELEARIGINTGNVIVGNMGSQSVFDYTVMGDSVNLGARLEGANKIYGTDIMISEFTHMYVKNEFYTRPLDLIRVKGKTKPVEVYELIAERSKKLSSQYLEMLSVYQRGVLTYRRREWDSAIDLFDYCLKLNPEDRTSMLYKKRCLEFKINDPGSQWDGVFTMTTK